MICKKSSPLYIGRFCTSTLTHKPGVMMLIGTCIIFIILIIIIVIGIFWWLSYWVLFYPSPTMIWEPNDAEYLDLYLPIDPDRAGQVYHPGEERPYPCINVWHFNKFNNVNRRGHCAATILYFHGNSGNISHRGYVVDICRRFGINLLLVDYCGYGRSDGIVDPDLIYRDGEIAYRYLSGEINPSNIIVWGESLGGTVACYIASKYQCKCLILLATFSSLEDVLSKSGYPKWMSGTFAHMIRRFLNPMESKVYLQSIKCPVAIMHSEGDTLIPIDCGHILYDHIPHANKQFFVISGDHASPDISNDNLASLLAFAGIQGQCLNKEVDYVTELLRTITQRQPDLIPDGMV